jgi:hypothetical protein
VRISLTNALDLWFGCRWRFFEITVADSSCPNIWATESRNDWITRRGSPPAGGPPLNAADWVGGGSRSGRGFRGTASSIPEE